MKQQAKNRFGIEW